MAAKAKQAKIFTPEEWAAYQRPVPKSFLKAAGMLRRHKKALERHLEKVRREWDRR